jgi:hypothetical protein
VAIQIGGAHIKGSPTAMRLTSTMPDLAKSELKGDGLSTAMAGKDTTFIVHFVDTFSNAATPGDEMKLGMALVSEVVTQQTGDKPDISTAPSHKFERTWVDEGQLKVTYIATVAGGNELHIWCDQAGGMRTPLPGSPFSLSVFSGKGNLGNSEVTGYCRDAEAPDRAGGKWNVRNLPEYIDDTRRIITGDVVLIRPKILDEFGNPAKLPDGALTVTHQFPNGDSEPVNVQPQTRGGLTTYDIRDTPLAAGTHEAHVLLYSKPIKGSPVKYVVGPDYHEAAMSVLEPPSPPEGMENLFTEEEYLVKLQLRDRFGNNCNRGGAIIAARLNYLKQGVHDSTSLTPTNHSCVVEDLDNGTYLVRVTLSLGSSERALFPASLNLEVNLDKDPKERPTGINLPPVTLTFVRNPNTETTLQTLQRGGKMVQNINRALSGMKDKSAAGAPAENPVAAPATAAPAPATAVA